MAQPYSTVAIAWLLTLAVPSGAQVPSFASHSEIVVLSATAVDDRGRPVTNLQRKEFTVLEDGRPQQVLHFSAGPAVSARVLILVDASGSMNAEVKAASARMAVTQFLAALSPEDQVALAGFDSEYWGIVGWTRDRRKVEAGVRDLKPFGSTALHDALDRRLFPALPGFVTPRRERHRALAFEPFRSRLMAPPVLAGASQALFVRPRFAGFGHCDAVDGTRRQAQLAAGAFRCDHRMHEVRGADYGIHRACLDAERAADARLLVYDGHRRGFGQGLRHGDILLRRRPAALLVADFRGGRAQ